MAGRVEGYERLYRSVRLRDVEFGEDGSARPKLSAFFDRADRPSVNRATLGATPSGTREADGDGVLELVADEVRALDAAQRLNDKKVVLSEHAYEVEPEPIPDNAAHAVVLAVPPMPACPGRLRDKWCEALKRLAWKRGWLLAPNRGPGPAA